MSALILTTPDGKETRTVPIHNDRLFLENFEVVCRLSRIDPQAVVFVFDGKVYRYERH